MKHYIILSIVLGIVVPRASRAESTNTIPDDYNNYRGTTIGDGAISNALHDLLSENEQFSANASYYLVRAFHYQSSDVVQGLEQLIGSDKNSAQRIGLMTFTMLSGGDHGRVSYKQGIVELSHAIPVLAAMIPNTQHKEMAFEALWKCGEKSVPVLVDFMQNGDKRSQLLASSNLRRFASGPKEKWPLLIYKKKIQETLGSVDMETGTELASLLLDMGDKSEPVATALAKAVQRHPSNDTRSLVADRLGELGEHASIVVPALCDALGDKDWGVRGAACHALAVLGPKAKDAIPALHRLLKQRKIIGNRNVITGANTTEGAHELARRALASIGEKTEQ